MTYIGAWATGGTVDDDPTSSNFMGIKVGNKTYNFTGGFSQYISQVSQDIKGGKTINGNFVPFKETGRGVRGRWENVLHFMRGKTTPVMGAAINQATGKDYAGQPVKLGGQISSLLTPLSLRGVVTDMKRDGLSSIYKADIPNFFGLGVKDARDYADISRVKNIEVSDKQKDFLGKKGLRAPVIQGIDYYQVEKDERHPNEMMTPEEYDIFVKKVSEYSKDKIDEALDANYNVDVINAEGYKETEDVLEGWEMDKYKNFEVVNKNDKWIVTDDEGTNYSYSDTKAEAESKMLEKKNIKLQGYIDAAVELAIKDAKDDINATFVEKDETKSQNLNKPKK